MALIKCMECGGVVSDTALVCPHCGAPIIKCRECGRIMGAGEDVCPACGHPADFIYEHEPQRNYCHASRKRKPLKSILVIGGVALLLVFLMVTCPGKSRHEVIIQERIAESVEEVRDSLGMSSGLAFLSEMILDKITKVMVGHKFHVDNYLVCSVGKFRHHGEETVLTFGMAHHVWCFVSKDRIKSFVSQYKREKQKDAGNMLSSIKRLFGFGGDDAEETQETEEIDESDLFNSLNH